MQLHLSAKNEELLGAEKACDRIQSFTSFCKYLMRTFYVSSTTLGTGDTAVSKVDIDMTLTAP